MDSDDGQAARGDHRAPYSKRRAVYGFIDRQNLPGLFRTFDFASPDTHSPQRYTTTVPQQALFMMNSPFVIEQARALASKPGTQGVSNLQRMADSGTLRAGVRAPRRNDGN